MIGEKSLFICCGKSINPKAVSAVELGDCLACVLLQDLEALGEGNTVLIWCAI